MVLKYIPDILVKSKQRQVLINVKILIFIGSGDGQKVSCPQKKEDAIMDAFRHFNMI